MGDSDSVASALPPGAGQLFMPRTHRQALAELVRGILAGEPFAALTGKPGVGKTTVLNAAIAALAERTLRIRRIDNPHGTPLRLPQIIGELVGNSAGAVTNEDIERLFDSLTLNDNGGQLVLVFDDAQYLQADVLGYLQIVSSLHALGIRHQQVIFTGRPEFWSLLKDPKLCDLVERIKVRPVIEPLCEAEARDFLYYRLEQMYGPVRQHVPGTALSRLIHYGDGVPGRLEPILMKSLAAAGGYRQLRPETIDAAACGDASAAATIVMPTAPARSSGQMVASRSPPALIPKIPERRRPAVYPGALVCLAVLLAGGIGTAWHSSVLSDPPEISGPAAAPASLPEPPARPAIMLAANAASPPDASAASQAAAPGAADSAAPTAPGLATSSQVDPAVVTGPTAPMAAAKQQPTAVSTVDTSTPVTAANQEASPTGGSLPPDAGMGSGRGLSSPPPRAGIATVPDAASLAQGSPRLTEAGTESAQPQSSSEAPASPPAAVAPPPTATPAVVPQPPPAEAASAAPQPAPASPRATDAVVLSTQPQSSPEAPASPPAAVAPPPTATPAVVPQPPPAEAASAAPQPAPASPRATDAVVLSTQPQSSSEAPASPPAAVAPPPTATPAVVPQPPPAEAASAAPKPAPASPRAIDAVVLSTQPPTASVTAPAGTAAAVAAQKTDPANEQAQPPNAPPPSVTTPSAMVSSTSTNATAESAQPEHPPATPAASPEVPISPAVTDPTVLAVQRDIPANSVTAPLPTQTEPPKLEATAPAAPAPAVSVTPAHLETLAPAATGTPALPAPSPSPYVQAAPTDTQTAQQPTSLPPEILADLRRRGDAMLAIGDVSSARLLYRRAAQSGNARATTQLAKTYDPLFLMKIGATGMPTDAATAAKWYRRAAALGDAEAAERLKRLGEAKAAR